MKNLFERIKRDSLAYLSEKSLSVLYFFMLGYGQRGSAPTR